MNHLPPGDGNRYLATGSGWAPCIAPELTADGILEIIDHPLLKNRDAADQHPQSAILYLTSDLQTIQSDIATRESTSATKAELSAANDVMSNLAYLLHSPIVLTKTEA